MSYYTHGDRKKTRYTPIGVLRAEARVILVTPEGATYLKARPTAKLGPALFSAYYVACTMAGLRYEIGIGCQVGPRSALPSLLERLKAAGLTADISAMTPVPIRTCRGCGQYRGGGA